MVSSWILTPSLPQPHNISGLKSVHLHSCKQYIYWSCKNILSVLCILIEVLSHAHLKQGGGGGAFQVFKDFKFDTFTGDFPSDSMASMAVKGLMPCLRSLIVVLLLLPLYSC